MKILKMKSWMILCAVTLLLAGQAARAQQVTVPARVLEAVDDTRTVQLKGNVHPLARAEFDQGALPDSQPMTRMLLLLQRSDAQEASLRQLMDAQQTKGSSSYHAWLTPEQFGKQYGPADADVQAVTDWLTRQGFQVVNVAAGRTVIEFSGNVGQVRNAFHTQIHKYLVNGEEHFANASDPAIPEALAPVVKGVVALHNFPKHSYLRSAGLYQRTKATGELKPLFSFGNPLNYAMGPADFATIYNIPATVNGAPAGTGQTIAVVGQSNINVADIQAFRAMFGLPANFTQSNVIVNGTDPGIVAPPSPGILTDESESDLDVEWSGAIAPNAQILFVTSQSTISNPTQVSAGIDLSALYIVDNNLAPVMSESYGECEAYLLTAGNQFYNQLWEQAAAQGITVAIAAGDSGPASCDPYANDPDPDAANQGLNVSGTASTPYNVAVGGTDFDPVQVQNPTTYWNGTNTANTQESAIGYIPEVPWDDSACALNYPGTPCTSVNANGADLAAGAGGPSNCIQTTVNNSTGVITCNTSGAFPNGIGYAKPAWQTPLTAADSVRDLPDISFFASDGFFSGVADVICESDQNTGGASCNLNTPFNDFMGVGGTSAATPAFAAVMALVNQQTGQRQGNANYVLYGLASKETYTNCNSSKFTIPTNPAPAGCTFYDITKGNNSVACDAGSPNCSNQGGSGYGVMVSSVGVDNGNPAFQAVAGYDLATGLGTINVGNLLTNWSNFSRTATTTTLGILSQSGQSLAASATVSPAPTGTAGTESVSVVALASDQTTVLGTIGPFTLTGGAASISTTLLPAGTAYVEARYGGDATFAASTSTPTKLATTVAGAGYTGKATVYFVGYNSSTGAPNTPTTSSQSFAYGTPYILSILVTNSGTSCAFGYPNTKPTSPAIPCPTGTIKLFDNGNAQNDFVNNSTNQSSLNNLGLVEDQPINLSATLNGTTPGAHNLTVTYSGDQNYSQVVTGGSNTLSLSVSKAATQTLVGTSPSVISSGGGSVTLGAYIATNSNGAGPGGTVQFANGSVNIGPALTCQGAASVSGSQDATPPISQITAGTAYCFVSTTTTIAALYPPGTVRPGPPSVPVVPLVVALVSLLLFALGWRWMPVGRRRAYAYAGLVAFALLVVGIVGCGGGGGGGGGGGSTVTINVTYSGDSNYSPSNGSAQITVQ
ncbi:MAG: protease pro-enzyme activation domain-containing protein [Candidatus Acidiferrum sp.]